jgi:hypothetical protein
MSAADVQTEIITPMQRLFYPPRKMEEADERAALVDYVQALQGFDAPDLKSSWNWVRDNHPKTSWPVPSAFVLAASRAKRDRQPGKHGARSGSPEGNERWERWKTVSRSTLAYEAVKHGVAWSLKCAILHDGKLPEHIALRDLVSAKHSAEKLADMIRRGDPGPFKGQTLKFTGPDAATALSMWAGIQELETKTQAEIRYSDGGAP